MRLVYLSPVPWKSFAQRPHKFVQWFHKMTGKPVLWLDPYPTRFPKLEDIFGIRESSTPASPSCLPIWLKVLKTGGLPIDPLPCSGWVNGIFWRRSLNIIDSFSKSTKTMLAIGKPSVLAIELLERLGHCPSFYDAMDDFPAFYSGLSRHALAQREKQIVKRVDSIWVSSSELYKRLGSYRDDICLVHNGLDVSAMPSLEKTQKISTKKVFGYVGTIASWFDWDWIHDLSRTRPNDEIRLIGPVIGQSIKALPNNIVLLPSCHHIAAMRAMMDFDVGLIPFKKNKLTSSVDPIKYYEYRALDLPVISTNFGEMSHRSTNHGVFLSYSSSDIASIAEAALRFDRDAEYAHAFAQRNAWETRFDKAKLFIATK